MKQSEGELVFSAHLSSANIKYEQEYRFCKERRWRADFALPDHNILVEIEGGVWNKGRHVTPTGFIKDCEKYNTAAALGWRVYRFPTGQVMNNSAIEFVVQHLI